VVSTVPNEEKTFQRALELDADERSSEAAKLLIPLIVHRDNPRYLLAYATFLLRSDGSWKEAVDCLRAALTIEPVYFEGGTRLFLADVLMRHGLKSEAIEQWRIVSKMSPDGTGYGAVPDEAIIRLREHGV
jgi:tetratricopeptide (TPR) repeat protein